LRQLRFALVALILPGLVFAQASPKKKPAPKQLTVTLETTLAKGTVPGSFLAYANPLLAGDKPTGQHFIAMAFADGVVSQVVIYFGKTAWIAFAFAESARQFYKDKLEDPKLPPFDSDHVAILVEVDGKIRFVELNPDDGGATYARNLLWEGQKLFNAEWVVYQKVLKDPAYKRPLLEYATDPTLANPEVIIESFSMELDVDFLSPQTKAKKKPLVR
jgi:hypothetical protein